MNNMPLARIYKAHTALLLIVFLLPGCTGVRLIDTQVNSFAPHTVAPGASYRFERLPSQQAQGAGQDQLEQLAEQALAQVGLHRAAASSLTVQVSAQQRQEPAQQPNGWGMGWGLGWGVGNGGISVGSRGALFSGLNTQPNYWRQVSLVMRNAQGQVVFESHASHEGLWADSTAILAAMLDAALQGFPTPPSGPRRVNIEIPR